MGNAWFVDNVKIVENADAEFEAIKSFDPETTALVDKRFEHLVKNINFTVDKNAHITLTKCDPNYLKYEYQAATEQFPVLSEV